MMNTLFDPKKKTIKPVRPKQVVDSFEIFKETPNKVVNEAKNTVTEAAGDFWKQLLGVDNKNGGTPKSGELKPGQALNLKDAQKSQENKPNNIAAAMNHSGEIMQSSENVIQRENMELKQTIQQLVTELKQLEKSNPTLSVPIEQATGNITKVGKYHQTFFQHVFSILREARQRASGGEAWKNAINKKGQAPGIHKLMKTNMQVGMSSERAVATSVG